MSNKFHWAMWLETKLLDANDAPFKTTCSISATSC